MVAIAKELGAEGIRKAEVILAVGLPFSDYGREKKALLEYYGQKPTLKYEYEGIRYDVTASFSAMEGRASVPPPRLLMT